jgi:hypothetical protein
MKDTHVAAACVRFTHLAIARGRHGAWRSLVAHLLWEHGSNPAQLSNNCNRPACKIPLKTYHSAWRPISEIILRKMLAQKIRGFPSSIPGIALPLEYQAQ